MDRQVDVSPDAIRAQVAALRYLVLMLLQRLDADGYASVAEITAGVRQDWLRLDPGVPDHAVVEAAFRETLAILEGVGRK
ncbi:MAG: hypothetical protein GAK35_01575 [Herbaspirillum frisingense]|uniref:Uncharacterized protein n=1 Tax=Herbaspirillum frisingense TaxID=92645 RepID=A0A7V8FXP6_9BURK|nr:MAG: hypothetical protein GAK35_01575 [Herbaspirillum frisingense]